MGAGGVRTISFCRWVATGSDVHIWLLVLPVNAYVESSPLKLAFVCVSKAGGPQCPLLLTFVSCCPAAAYEAPAWACSPAPMSSNPLCPGSARGDARCSRRECAPDAGCAREECNAVQGNIQGTTVVLDAWLSIRGSSCKKTQWTVSECCALCQESPSCNAWSFCNNLEGCGTGCVASLHEHKASETPMHTISPVTYTRRLNPDHHCTAAGAWPYQTCSLRFVEEGADPDSPPLMRGEGWGTSETTREQ